MARQVGDRLMLRVELELPATWGELRRFVALGQRMPDEVDVELVTDPWGNEEIGGLAVALDDEVV